MSGLRLLALAALAAAALAVRAESPDEALRRRIVEAAQEYKGTPYVYGADAPPAFDCSGFVQYVYRKAADLVLPRNSKGQYAAGAPIAKAALLPGDILVFDTVGGSPSHVAIFLGGSSMIHAASAGPRTGVIVSPLDDSYFGPRFIGARSFLGDGKGLERGPAIAQATPATQAAGPAPAVTPSAPAATPPVPAAKPPTPTKPAAPAAPAAKPAASEPAIAQIGFTIPPTRASHTDKIPAATGTGLAFTLTNGTGKDGRFVVIFYKTEKDFSKSTEIHRELASIKAGGAVELPPYVFTEPGIYKLIVKDNWNEQLIERVWRVIERK